MIDTTPPPLPADTVAPNQSRRFSQVGPFGVVQTPDLEPDIVKDVIEDMRFKSADCSGYGKRVRVR